MMLIMKHTKRPLLHFLCQLNYIRKKKSSLITTRFLYSSRVVVSSCTKSLSTKMCDDKGEKGEELRKYQVSNIFPHIFCLK